MPDSPNKLKLPNQHAKSNLDLSHFSAHTDATLEEEEQEQQSPRRKRRLLLVLALVVVVLVAVAIGVYLFFFRSSSSRPAYHLLQVGAGNLTVVTQAGGSIQAQMYGADFIDTGTIVAIYVKPGATVTQGQNLARIILQNKISQFLKAPHSGTVIAINGKVGGTVNANTSSGSGNANTSGGTSSFIQLTDLAALSIQANIDQTAIIDVSVGDVVQFTISAYGNQTFTGKVSAVYPIGQKNANTVTYPVSISIDPQALQHVMLLPNMTANVTIITGRLSGVIVIPAQALSFAQQALPRGYITSRQSQSLLAQEQQLLDVLNKSGHDPARNHYSGAFVLELAHNKLVSRAVVLGTHDGSFYELVSGLVFAGDQLIVGVN